VLIDQADVPTDMRAIGLAVLQQSDIFRRQVADIDAAQPLILKINVYVDFRRSASLETERRAAPDYLMNSIRHSPPGDATTYIIEATGSPPAPPAARTAQSASLARQASASR
jgi:hypothetical protein